MPTNISTTSSQGATANPEINQTASKKLSIKGIVRKTTAPKRSRVSTHSGKSNDGVSKSLKSRLFKILPTKLKRPDTAYKPLIDQDTEISDSKATKNIRNKKDLISKNDNLAANKHKNTSSRLKSAVSRLTNSAANAYGATFLTDKYFGLNAKSSTPNQGTPPGITPTSTQPDSSQPNTDSPTTRKVPLQDKNEKVPAGITQEPKERRTPSFKIPEGLEKSLDESNLNNFNEEVPIDESESLITAQTELEPKAPTTTTTQPDSSRPNTDSPTTKKVPLQDKNEKVSAETIKEPKDRNIRTIENPEQLEKSLDESNLNNFNEEVPIDESESLKKQQEYNNPFDVKGPGNLMIMDSISDLLAKEPRESSLDSKNLPDQQNYKQQEYNNPFDVNGPGNLIMDSIFDLLAKDPRESSLDSKSLPDQENKEVLIDLLDPEYTEDLQNLQEPLDIIDIRDQLNLIDLQK